MNELGSSPRLASALLLATLAGISASTSAASASAAHLASAEESLRAQVMLELGPFASRGDLAAAPATLSEASAKVAIDAVESLADDGVARARIERVSRIIDVASLPLADTIRLLRLDATPSTARDGLDRAARAGLAAAVVDGTLDPRAVHELALLERAGLRLAGTEGRAASEAAHARFADEFARLAPTETRAFTPPSAEQLRALYSERPALDSYRDGSYADKPRLFLFCRHDRSQACVLLLKDGQDRPVRDDRTGKPWFHPGLALSKYGKPFDQTNGDTPQGVYQVDGVMPVTDAPKFYGKFRRMILDFPPRSRSEATFKALLPPSHHALTWWRDGVVGRDVGRSLLRIHGSGQVSDPAKPYYPLFPTSGCVAQRENRYDGVEYVDQRRLLDAIMVASQLDARFENEPRIQALLYVIEIDDLARAVTLDDLAQRGIR